MARSRASESWLRQVLLLFAAFEASHAFLVGTESWSTRPLLRVVPLPSWSTVPLTQRSAASSNNHGDDEMKDPNDSSERPIRNDTLVTREMFQRDLLADPVVKRPSKNSNKGKRNNNNSKQQREYKILDNRDSLPFRIENQEPDPYTKAEIKRRRANKVRKRPGSIEEGLKSSLYLNSNDKDAKQSSSSSSDDARTLLGEYYLDQHTTTGDVLEIGDMRYKVVRHKCQYKYAGGQRFVMVRKILQVKEIGRLQAEEYLHRTWRRSGENSSGSGSDGALM